MEMLAPIVENPWIFVLIAVFTLLVVGAAMVVARAERARSATVGFPTATYPTRRLVASAPLEAMAALHARLLELHRRLPPGSDDRRWLLWFASRLRDAMDEAYARLDAAPPSVQGNMIERLGLEVEALASVVNLQLSTTSAKGADRQALEAQLAALRASLR